MADTLTTLNSLTRLNTGTISDTTSNLTRSSSLNIPITQLNNIVEENAFNIARNIIQAQSTVTVNNTLSGQIYTSFDVGSDIISNQVSIITNELFPNSDTVLLSNLTSSTYTVTDSDSNSWIYYYDYSQVSQSLFSIAYGEYATSAFAAGPNSASLGTYMQYASMLLQPGDDMFTLADGTNITKAIILNVNRSLIKDGIDPGNLFISSSVGMIIDDSNGTNEDYSVDQTKQVYNLMISGSTHSTYVGLLYPAMGICVLQSSALGISSYTDFTTANKIKLTSIQGRSRENISSTYYFVRIKNAEFNYSNNPTFTTGSVGLIRQTTFYTDPKTYITTIGLYNDRNELLAVAKTSKPIQKSFSNELLLKIKLDF